MIQRPTEGLFILIVYALAAISGGLGGCATWAWHTSRFNNQKRRVVYLMAYLIIGGVFGTTSAALAMIYSWVTTLDQLILYSTLCGAVGTVTIFAINWGAGLILRWRGVELRLTFRDKQRNERRTVIDGDDRN